MSKGKKIKMKWRTGVCAIEKYVDENKKPKRTFYCSDCGEYMCVECSRNVVKRAMALILRDMNKKVKI